MIQQSPKYKRLTAKILKKAKMVKMKILETNVHIWQLKTFLIQRKTVSQKDEKPHTAGLDDTAITAH